MKFYLNPNRIQNPPNPRKPSVAATLAFGIAFTIVGGAVSLVVCYLFGSEVLKLFGIR